MFSSFVVEKILYKTGLLSKDNGERAMQGLPSQDFTNSVPKCTSAEKSFNANKEVLKPDPANYYQDCSSTPEGFTR